MKDTGIVHINTIKHTNTHPVNCKIYSIQLNKYVFHCLNLNVIKACLAFCLLYFRKTENILHDSLKDYRNPSLWHTEIVRFDKLYSHLTRKHCKLPEIGSNATH